MYQQKYTLKDIFNDQKLKGKIPLINYKETLQDNGKISHRTHAKTINTLVFDTSVSAARPYYKPIKPTRNGDIMIMGGNLVGDQNSAVNAVYDALVARQQMMIWTVNNADIIRSALKESELNQKKYGGTSKLYLKVGSLQEIESMSNKQLNDLMNDIMQNIYYGDDFPETQKKWNLQNIKVGIFGYNMRKSMWERKVGF